MSNLCKNSENWDMPKVPEEEVFNEMFVFNFNSKTGMYGFKKNNFKTGIMCGFKKNDAIKTVEKTVYAKDLHRGLQLLNQAKMKAHKRWYKYLHLGLVQISVKPLNEEGLNESVVVCLADGRFIKMMGGVLGMVEASLSDGPVYFNCFPNYSVPLESAHKVPVAYLEAAHGCGQNLAITYRVCYKLLKSPASNNSHSKTTPGETTLFQANIENSGVGMKRIIKWSEVSVPERWTH